MHTPHTLFLVQFIKQWSASAVHICSSFFKLSKNFHLFHIHAQLSLCIAVFISRHKIRSVNLHKRFLNFNLCNQYEWDLSNYNFRRENHLRRIWSIATSQFSKKNFSSIYCDINAIEIVFSVKMTTKKTRWLIIGISMCL